MRIQVAGGLALHRLTKANFCELLVPVAHTLLLTGDCLRPGDPVNNKFSEYLKNNWNRVIYLPGGSEMRSPGIIRNNMINCEYRIQQQLGNEYTLYGLTYIPWWDTSLLNKEEDWLYNILTNDDTNIIIGSYGKIPEVALNGNIITTIQGDNNFNQFDYTKGPITNHRTCRDGHLRNDYNPKFTLEIPHILS